MSELRRIFISYATSDREAALQIANLARAFGIGIWIDHLEMRPGDDIGKRIADAIQKVDYLALLVSRKSIERKWVQAELSLGVERETAGGVVRVIPCLLDDCPLPDTIADKLFCDFSQSFYQGLQQLLNGVLRDSRVVRARLDPADPVRLDEPELHAALAPELGLARAPIDCRFVLDAGELLRELEELWRDPQTAPSAAFASHLNARALDDYHQAERSDRRTAAARLHNLSVMLGAAADSVQTSMPWGVEMADWVARCLQRCVFLSACDWWRSIRACTSVSAISQLRSVNGAAALAVLEACDALQSPNEIVAATAAYLFHLRPEELLQLELAPGPRSRGARVWVPDRIVPQDTRQFWSTGHVPPASEISPIDWNEYFVPGIVRYQVQIARNLGRWLAEEKGLSVRIGDFPHMGAP